MPEIAELRFGVRRRGPQQIPYLLAHREYDLGNIWPQFASGFMTAMLPTYQLPDTIRAERSQAMVPRNQVRKGRQRLRLSP